MPRYPKEIEYSSKYSDDFYEYRHVILPEDIYKTLGKERKLLTETEWRNLGIKQSNGWEHYLIYENEPHILLFRRPKAYDVKTGKYPDDIFDEMKKYEAEKMKNLNIVGKNNDLF
jgi:cyclin-dependent kinase regulatory subunit CKS1